MHALLDWNIVQTFPAFWITFTFWTRYYSLLLLQLRVVTSELVNALTLTESTQASWDMGSSWGKHMGPVSANQKPASVTTNQWEPGIAPLPGVTHGWCMARVSQDDPSVNILSLDRAHVHLMTLRWGRLLMFWKIIVTLTLRQLQSAAANVRQMSHRQMKLTQKQALMWVNRNRTLLGKSLGSWLFQFVILSSLDNTWQVHKVYSSFKTF